MSMQMLMWLIAIFIMVIVKKVMMRVKRRKIPDSRNKDILRKREEMESFQESRSLRTVR
jgi:cytochrome c-type biogenesis protein CcmH/NrfF